MDVRIDPQVTTTEVSGAPVKVFALFLGGVPRGAAAVLVGPDGFGEIESVEVMNQLAQHGFESVLAQLPQDAADGVGAAALEHLVDRLTARDWTHEQMGLVGYGSGARTVRDAAARTTFGGVISLPSASAQILDPATTRLQSPWLGLIGTGSQPGLPADLADHLTKIRAASTEHVELVGYPGVENCLHDSTEALEHQAAFDSWQRTAEWLNIHVAPRPTPLAQAWQERQLALQSRS